MASVQEQCSLISRKPSTLFHTQYYHASFKQFIGISGSVHEWIMYYLTNRSQFTVLLMAANSLLAVFGLASPRDLSWAWGFMLLLSVTFLPALAIPGMFIYMQMTPPYLLLVKVLMKLLLLSTLWYRMCCSGAWIINSLYIHGPIKTEAMLIRKSPFNGPLPPLRFGFGYIRLVESSTCLGVKLDNRLSWPDHTSQVRKCLHKRSVHWKEWSTFP